MLNSHAASNPLDDLEPVTDAARDPQAGRASSAAGLRRRGRAALRRRADRGDPPAPTTSRSARPRARRCTWCGPPRRARRSHGRDYVLPDDVHMLARPVLAHRLLPSVEAAMSGRSTGSILDRIVASVPVPDAGSSTERLRARETRCAKDSQD